MENQDSSINPKHDSKHNAWLCCGDCGKGGGYGFAIILLIIGGFFLARDLGWIDVSISLWPILLLTFGVYLIIVKGSKK